MTIAASVFHNLPPRAKMLDPFSSKLLDANGPQKGLCARKVEALWQYSL